MIVLRLFISNPTTTAPVVGVTDIPSKLPDVDAETDVTLFVSVGVTQLPSPRKKVVPEPPLGT